jgi:DNA-directed RNA polymerase specialized sigma24 family protein
MILGYRRVGTNGTLPVIRRAADKVCTTLTRRITDHECVHDGGSLIRTLWQCATDEVERINAEADSTTQADSTMQKVSRKAKSRYVPGSGVAHRMGEQFQRLPEDQARIITQRVAGLYHGEVADAMGVDIGVTRGLYRAGIARLREAHGGQQIPTSEQELWQDVETSFPYDNGAPAAALRGTLPGADEVQIEAGLQECPSGWIPK